MKKIFLLNVVILLFASCGKQCLECSYPSLKGPIVEVRCSSIKADRDAFKNEMDSIAASRGEIAECKKETY